MALTGDKNYFENFRTGDVLRHQRGKTVMEYDNVATTLQVMNTATEHFDEHKMRQPGAIFSERVTFGGVTVATVIGLAMQDTGENAVRELGMDKIRLKGPVFHGDTLYAYSEVLSTDGCDQDAAGIVHFRHWGVNQKDQVIFEGERSVLIRKRPA